jgi:geranyl-CoA carboxylase alpha subunit
VFKKVLIANRGEIALRVIRACRELGLETVAVYSEADRESLHVRFADDDVCIGPPPSRASYLRIPNLIAAAEITGADAIHPGYGFLSENAEFAAAVASAGLVFIGPPPAAIAAMGDKARARQRMAAVGIPVVAGYDGDAQDAATMRTQAGRLGYPVMVKAAAGGGGRGMRFVQSEDDLDACLRAAASEAAKAFGDGRLILERAVVEPRHVEIQVLADRHGNVVHLGERDCSVQRRHQKVVEESPSPAVDADLRARMGATAVAVAREIGYVGAGTVEFLLDREGHFYFMEMNTRLQVEHPVTELVTGLDLVEWQFRIARGEALPFSQADVRLRGHAIEVRLCAESPADDFLPGSGRVVDWDVPGGVRCDHALAAGADVPAWYDSMVAKIVAHGATRTDCVAHLADALDHVVLLGVPSNREFLARVLRHEVFATGREVSTAFIGRHFDAGASRFTPPDARVWALAAWLSIAAAPETAATPAAWRHWSTARPMPHPWRLGWRAPASAPGAPHEQRGRVMLGAAMSAVESGERRLTIRGTPAPPRSHARATVDGDVLDYRFAWDHSTLWIHTTHGDFAFDCRRREAARAGRADAASATQVRASINARVLEVATRPGTAVQPGDRLVVLEAMKMEHEVRAGRSGRIAEVGVRVGEQVTPGQVLVRYEGETG